MSTYDDEEELKEVRILAKISKAGVLPKGYAVGSSNPHDLMKLVNLFSDFCFDPETAALTMRKNGYETEE